MTDIPSNPELKVTHHVPRSFADWAAMRLVKLLRFFADAFFQRRYGHRAVILETVAAVPGMVGGALVHLRCLREVVIAVRLDEAGHRDVNHGFADELAGASPAPPKTSHPSN
jgi:Alternative oxidase